MPGARIISSCKIQSLPLRCSHLEGRVILEQVLEVQQDQDLGRPWLWMTGSLAWLNTRLALEPGTMFVLLVYLKTTLEEKCGPTVWAVQ